MTWLWHVVDEFYFLDGLFICSRLALIPCGRVGLVLVLGVAYMIRVFMRSRVWLFCGTMLRCGVVFTLFAAIVGMFESMMRCVIAGLQLW